MNKALTTLLLAVLLLAIPGCERTPAVVAQADPPVEGDASAEYLALHAALGDDLLARVSEARGNAGPELSRDLQANKDLIDRLAYATRMPCVWDVPEEPDPDTTLPHLSKVRALAYTLNVDARRLAAEGDGDGASRRVAGLARLARHTADGGADSIIEWLLGNAILLLSAEAAIDLVNDFSDEQRGRVLAELLAVDADDPYAFEAKLNLHRDLMAQANLSPADENNLRAALGKTSDVLRRAISTLKDSR
ncbi:MAG: hypothetical protein ACIAS6_01215 [Phycisphaerales bacterium JB060]